MQPFPLSIFLSKTYSESDYLAQYVLFNKAMVKETKRKENEMLSKATARVMQFLMVCLIAVGGWLVIRLKGIEPGALAPKVDLKESLENYQQRMRATEQILLNDRL